MPLHPARLQSQKQQLRQQLDVASKARENARSSMKELRSSVKFTKGAFFVLYCLCLPRLGALGVHCALQDALPSCRSKMLFTVPFGGAAARAHTAHRLACLAHASYKFPTLFVCRRSGGH